MGIQWLLRKAEGGCPETKEEGEQREQVRVYCTGEASWTHRFLKRHSMAHDVTAGGVTQHTFYAFREDLNLILTSREVLEAVGKQPSSIGFLEYEPDLDFSGVDVLGTRDRWQDVKYVRPLLEPAIQTGYPAGEMVCLYLHPSAGKEAEEFCRFAVGPEGAKIVEQYGFLTPHMQEQSGKKAGQ